MSVRKRTLPSGEIRWQVDYRDKEGEDGKRRSRQFRTQKEALAHETKVRGEIAAGVHIADASSITIRKAGELWLQRCRLDELEGGTLRTYKQHLDLHILPLIGNARLCKLTRPAVESFKDRLLETRSVAMARKVLVSLKSLLSDAQRRGLAVQNAATGTRVRVASRHEKKIVIPTKDEIRAILNKTGELWPATFPWRPLVITALFTGLRPSELRGLTWDHVDFEKKVIRVRQRADYRNTMGSPKSKAGTRDVPLAPLVLNTLRQWRLACPKTELGLVFPAKDGGVVRHSGTHRIWCELLKPLDLPRHYRFYDLRHAAASLFIEQGMQPKKVQAIMGHSSIKMTFDLYGHLWETPEDDAAAMEQIEARLLS